VQCYPFAFPALSPPSIDGDTDCPSFSLSFMLGFPLQQSIAKLPPPTFSACRSLLSKLVHIQIRLLSPLSRETALICLPPRRPHIWSHLTNPPPVLLDLALLTTPTFPHPDPRHRSFGAFFFSLLLFCFSFGRGRFILVNSSQLIIPVPSSPPALQFMQFSLVRTPLFLFSLTQLFAGDTILLFLA